MCPLRGRLSLIIIGTDSGLMEISFNENIFSTLIEVWKFAILTVDGNAITVGTLTVGVALFVVGVLVSRSLSNKLSSKVLSRFIHEKSSLHSLESVSFYVLLVFFTLFALKIANIPLTIFTVLGGALAIGFGFGSQNIVNNLISGFILMIERPIKVGDFIDVDGLFGEIQDIGIRSTRILAFGNKHMIVPNSSFLDKNVHNWTHLDKNVRAVVRVGVAYGSDAEKVTELLSQSVKECMQKHDRYTNPDTMILFHDFGDNALIFDTYFWMELSVLNDVRQMQSKMRYFIYKNFNAAGITIAFPQRDVHIDTLSPLKVELTDPTL